MFHAEAPSRPSWLGSYSGPWWFAAPRHAREAARTARRPHAPTPLRTRGPFRHLPPRRGAGSLRLPTSACRGEPLGPWMSHNRYATTLTLTKDAQSRAANCSGILLNPRVVLTAPSCVCARQADKAICGCFPLRREEPPSNGPVRRRDGLGVHGRVDGEGLPDLRRAGPASPGIQLVLDAQGEIESSHADSAVIVLDSPVKDLLEFVPLGEDEAKENEVLVMAGFPNHVRALEALPAFATTGRTKSPSSRRGESSMSSRAPFLQRLSRGTLPSGRGQPPVVGGNCRPGL